MEIGGGILMVDLLLFLYLMSNIAVLAYMLNILDDILTKEVFERGFKVKHLLFIVLFIPAEVILATLVAVLFAVFKVIEFISTGKIGRILNKKIFK